MVLDNKFYCYSASFASASFFIKAVIFDLDGVLMDSEWLGFEAWRELAAQHGGTLADSAFFELAGTTAEQTAEIVMRCTGVKYDLQKSVAWTVERVADQIRQGIQPLPGAVDLVRALAARSLPLAIASNSATSFINNALQGLGLSPFFPLRVGVDQVSFGKPAPDVYLSAAGQLGVSPERCLVFEDSRVGVQAAVAAGMRVVAVPGERDRQDGFQSAWRIYPSLVNALEALEELLA